MLTRNNLLKLQIPDLPKRRNDAIYRTPYVNLIYRSALAANGKLLIVAFYEREVAAKGFSLPSLVLYQARDGYASLLHVTGQQSWSQASLMRILPPNYHSAIGCREHDELRIVAFCESTLECRGDSEEGALDALYRLQSQILHQRNMERRAKQAATIDALMRQVPKLPKGFENWIDRGPLKRSRYIFYRSIARGVYKCYCSHCNSFVAVEKPRHKESGLCPSCGSSVEFRAAGRTGKIKDSAHTCILQWIPRLGEYVLRYFEVERESSCVDQWEHRTVIDEQARLFFRPDGTITRQFKQGRMFESEAWAWSKTRDKIIGDNVRWDIPVWFCRKIPNVWFVPAFLYPYNVHSILRRHGLSYYEMKRHLYGREQNVTTYLLQCFRYPFAPSLSRIGLDLLAHDLLAWGKLLPQSRPLGVLHRQLHVPKCALRIMKQGNAGIDALNTLSLFEGKQDALEDLDWLIQHRIDRESIELAARHASAKRIRLYLEKQKKTEFGVDRMEREIAGFWSDYLRMANELRCDLSVRQILFPQKLQNEHDKVMQLTHIKYDPVADEKIQKLYPRLQSQYGLENETFLLRPPRDFQDFADEGVGLLHCVCTGGYYNKHVSGDTFIFLIRRKAEPEKPFYTMEYRPSDGEIVQLQGFRHCRATATVQAFADRWLREAAQRMGRIAA